MCKARFPDAPADMEQNRNLSMCGSGKVSGGRDVRPVAGGTAGVCAAQSERARVRASVPAGWM